uniref:Uncharacterized protein n=1 Tax=Trichobilharzia regenti TaxID=157069 RepID=A0AA85IX37_TRIRE|nr:unnamed protein product [Trichobilharzia regenti]
MFPFHLHSTAPFICLGVIGLFLLLFFILRNTFSVALFLMALIDLYRALAGGIWNTAVCVVALVMMDTVK